MCSELIAGVSYRCSIDVSVFGYPVFITLLVLVHFLVSRINNEAGTETGKLETSLMLSDKLPFVREALSVT